MLRMQAPALPWEMWTSCWDATDYLSLNMRVTELPAEGDFEALQLLAARAAKQLASAIQQCQLHRHYLSLRLLLRSPGRVAKVGTSHVTSCSHPICCKAAQRRQKHAQVHG